MSGSSRRLASEIEDAWGVTAALGWIARSGYQRCLVVHKRLMRLRDAGEVRPRTTPAAMFVGYLKQEPRPKRTRTTPEPDRSDEFIRWYLERQSDRGNR